MPEIELPWYRLRRNLGGAHRTRVVQHSCRDPLSLEEQSLDKFREIIRNTLKSKQFDLLAEEPEAVVASGEAA